MYMYIYGAILAQAISGSHCILARLPSLRGYHDFAGDACLTYLSFWLLPASAWCCRLCQGRGLLPHGSDGGKREMPTTAQLTPDQV